MNEFLELKENCQLQRHGKIDRKVYKAILRAQIARQRVDLYNSILDVKQGFSFSGLWQKFIPGSSTGAIKSFSKSANLFASHPYVLIYLAKQIFSVVLLRNKTKTFKAILLAVLASGLYLKSKDH